MQEVQEVHLQEGEGSTCGATQVNPPQPPIGQLASLSCALIGRHRCGVAQAAIPGLRALSLSGGKIGLAGQMSSFYLPSSQLPSSSSAGRSKLESANIQGRSSPNAGMGGKGGKERGLWCEFGIQACLLDPGAMNIDLHQDHNHHDHHQDHNHHPHPHQGM